MTSSPPRALVLSFSPVAGDPRVMRQMRVLAPRFELTLAGFGRRPDGVKEFVGLVPPSGSVSATRIKRVARLFARRFEAYYWGLAHVAQARAALHGRHFDLVVANDVHALPLALVLAGSAAVLLDAHEYSPLEFENSLSWRMLHAPYIDWICRTCLPRVRAMTTVAPGIADAYREAYGVGSEVIYSAPEYVELKPLPVATDRVRIVHHGAAIPARRIELMIEVMDLLDARFELDFMLVPGNRRYIERLTSLARQNSRIRMLDPVRMEEIVPFTNRYDIGMFLLPPANFNYAHALPNKFFEFIQARLAVAIGPSPEMRGLVERYGCGLVAGDFLPGTLARALAALTPERIGELKANSHRAARELCFEHSAPAFLAAAERALGAR